ncbi:hypothetical protein [Streptomyces sp. NPDC002853]
MRSLKIATGTFLASTALLVVAPPVLAAPMAPSSCEEAQSLATEAEADYEAAKKQYEGGDTSLKQQVAEAEQNANSLASQAQRICGDTVMNPTAPASKKPSGAMRTGAGSSSSDPSSIPALAAAGGLAVVSAAGFVALRGRIRSRQS